MQLYCSNGKPNILTHTRGKRLEQLGYARRTNGDVLKNVLTGKISEKRLLGRPKARYCRKGYETVRWKCNARLDFGQ